MELVKHYSPDEEFAYLSQVRALNDKEIRQSVRTNIVRPLFYLRLSLPLQDDCVLGFVKDISKTQVLQTIEEMKLFMLAISYKRISLYQKAPPNHFHSFWAKVFNMDDISKFEYLQQFESPYKLLLCFTDFKSNYTQLMSVEELKNTA